MPQFENRFACEKGGLCKIEQQLVYYGATLAPPSIRTVCTVCGAKYEPIYKPLVVKLPEDPFGWLSQG